MEDEAEKAGRDRRLTFEQHYGLEDMPRQLRPDEMPPTLRVRLLEEIERAVSEEVRTLRIREGLGPAWRPVAMAYLAKYRGYVAGSHELTKGFFLEALRSDFASYEPIRLYGMLEMIIRKLGDSFGFSRYIEDVLVQERSAFRLDGDTLYPIGSEAEAYVIASALAHVRQVGHGGAETHLMTAVRRLSEGQFSDSVRESVNAVESVLGSITGKTGGVGDATAVLQKKNGLAGTLKSAMGSLYGYASNHPGVRHSQSEAGDAKVPETEAMLILGICASLTTYLLSEFRPE